MEASDSRQQDRWLLLLSTVLAILVLNSASRKCVVFFSSLSFSETKRRSLENSSPPIQNWGFPWEMCWRQCIWIGALIPCCMWPLQPTLFFHFKMKITLQEASFVQTTESSQIVVEGQTWHRLSTAKMKMMLSQFRSPACDTWVELPKSKYGIQYNLGGSSPSGQWQKGVARFLRSGAKKTSKLSPFERMIQSLNEVTQRDGHNVGTALMYIREIIEPGDSEFEYIGDHVSARQLSQEQVDRLRIMILPWRREAKIVTYLNRIAAIVSANQSQTIFSSSGILTEFEVFQNHYFSIHSPQRKLDELFGFSFAIKYRSEWIFEYESKGIRENIMASLARHWRNLIRLHTPQQLGTRWSKMMPLFRFGY